MMGYSHYRYIIEVRTKEGKQKNFGNEAVSLSYEDRLQQCLQEEFVETSSRLLKMPSKLIRILRITFCYKQLCGRCLVHTTQVVKVVIHCIFALL